MPYGIVSAAPAYNIKLEKVNNNLRDLDSLQRGASLFTNYCMACHSVQYMRYNRIARDLGWTDEQAVEVMSFNQAKPVDYVLTRMDPGVSEQLFGIEAPDLSLLTRVKGNDYIYTFIRGYYEEEEGKWNNKVLTGTSMPNVLEGLKRHATEEEFDQATTDLVNFLDYVGEPSKVERWDLGWKVILFLLLLLTLTYLLKREYWKDIKH
ncbi:cytochrome c1 [Thiomicrospira microaerophila]|uniref:cytochrome c1 n=1 Tax=Thiomicrospira microaerophila TaxID=406020 RepID=UPI00200FDE05|nr:cytochrome c1 [Thiomicrospira microaerophila]